MNNVSLVAEEVKWLIVRAVVISCLQVISSIFEVINFVNNYIYIYIYVYFILFLCFSDV